MHSLDLASDKGKQMEKQDSWGKWGRRTEPGTFCSALLWKKGLFLEFSILGTKIHTSLSPGFRNESS